MTKPINTEYDPNVLPPRPAEGQSIQAIMAGVHKPLDAAVVTPHNPHSTGRHN